MTKLLEDVHREGSRVRERLRASGAYSSRERINRNERRFAATIEVAERPQSPWNMEQKSLVPYDKPVI